MARILRRCNFFSILSAKPFQPGIIFSSRRSLENSFTPSRPEGLKIIITIKSSAYASWRYSTSEDIRNCTTVKSAAAAMEPV